MSVRVNSPLDYVCEGEFPLGLRLWGWIPPWTTSVRVNSPLDYVCEGKLSLGLRLWGWIPLWTTSGRVNSSLDYVCEGESPLGLRLGGWIPPWTTSGRDGCLCFSLVEVVAASYERFGVLREVQPEVVVSLPRFAWCSLWVVWLEVEGVRVVWGVCLVLWRRRGGVVSAGVQAL